MVSTFKIKYLNAQGHVNFVNIDAVNPEKAANILITRIRDNGGGAIKIMTTKNVGSRRKAKVHG